MRNIILVMMSILCLFPARAALADCVSDCQASTYCDNTPGWDCSRLLNDCYARECSNPSPSETAPRHSGAYGAIAYDEDSGAYGLSDSSPDKSSAKKSALGYCSRNGNHCAIVKTIKNTCAAIAQNVAGTVAWAINDDRKAAGMEAWEKCNKKSDDHLCHIALMHCYGD